MVSVSFAMTMCGSNEWKVIKRGVPGVWRVVTGLSHLRSTANEVKFMVEKEKFNRDVHTSNFCLGLRFCDNMLVPLLPPRLVIILHTAWLVCFCLLDYEQIR